MIKNVTVDVEEEHSSTPFSFNSREERKKRKKLRSLVSLWKKRDEWREWKYMYVIVICRSQ
jgi:hypothetical protein